MQRVVLVALLSLAAASGYDITAKLDPTAGSETVLRVHLGVSDDASIQDSLAIDYVLTPKDGGSCDSLHPTKSNFVKGPIDGEVPVAINNCAKGHYDIALTLSGADKDAGLAVLTTPLLSFEIKGMVNVSPLPAIVVINRKYPVTLTLAAHPAQDVVVNLDVSNADSGATVFQKSVTFLAVDKVVKPQQFDLVLPQSGSFEYKLSSPDPMYTFNVSETSPLSASTTYPASTTPLGVLLANQATAVQTLSIPVASSSPLTVTLSATGLQGVQFISDTTDDVITQLTIPAGELTAAYRIRCGSAAGSVQLSFTFAGSEGSLYSLAPATYNVVKRFLYKTVGAVADGTMDRVKPDSTVKAVLSLDAAESTDLTINIQTSLDRAPTPPPTDYSVPSTVVIPAGQTSTTFDITIGHFLAQMKLSFTHGYSVFQVIPDAVLAIAAPFTISPSSVKHDATTPVTFTMALKPAKAPALTTMLPLDSPWPKGTGFNPVKVQFDANTGLATAQLTTAGVGVLSLQMTSVSGFGQHLIAALAGDWINFKVYTDTQLIQQKPEIGAGLTTELTLDLTSPALHSLTATFTVVGPATVDKPTVSFAAGQQKATVMITAKDQMESFTVSVTLSGEDKDFFKDPLPVQYSIHDSAYFVSERRVMPSGAFEKVSLKLSTPASAPFDATVYLNTKEITTLHFAKGDTAQDLQVTAESHDTLALTYKLTEPAASQYASSASPFTITVQDTASVVIVPSLSVLSSYDVKLEMSWPVQQPLSIFFSLSGAAGEEAAIATTQLLPGESFKTVSLTTGGNPGPITITPILQGDEEAFYSVKSVTLDVTKPGLGGGVIAIIVVAAFIVTGTIVGVAYNLRKKRRAQQHHGNTYVALHDPIVPPAY